MTPALFYDVQVNGVTTGTATVCITNPAVSIWTTIEYWDGSTSSWVYASNRTVSGSQVCGDVPVTALRGTPIALVQKLPTLTLPPNVVVEASGPSGAVVTFTVTAVDVLDSSIPTSCTPASGSTFPLGTATVNCTATDSHGSIATGSFLVTVRDTTPPFVTVPSDITVEAAGPTGAIATYATSASDAVSVVSFSCTPASGSTFVLGTTLVNCNAADAAGNIGSAFFHITVQDTTPPALTLPADITVLARSGSGTAIVTYSATATDLVDGPVLVFCSPLSGSIFSLGTTKVNCSATDTHMNIGTGLFKVSVQDFSISSPATVNIFIGSSNTTTITIGSLSGFNSPVTLASSTPGVMVAFNPNPVTPSAGSITSTATITLLPYVTPSTFTLQATASIQSLTHSTSLTVNVRPSISGLIGVVTGLLKAGCIQSPIANTLSTELYQAQAALNSGDLATARTILATVQNQVKTSSGISMLNSCNISGTKFNPISVLIVDVSSLLNVQTKGQVPNLIVGQLLSKTGSGIAGATVVLLDSKGTVLAGTVTDSRGFYFFAATPTLNLLPGSLYTVRVTALPRGYTSTLALPQLFTWKGYGIALQNFQLV